MLLDHTFEAILDWLDINHTLNTRRDWSNIDHTLNTYWSNI